MIELTTSVIEQPDAVFVRKTNASSFDDCDAFQKGGYAIAQALLTAADPAAPDKRTFVIKPNVVAASNKRTREPGNPDGGIVTNPDFVKGIIQRLRELGATNIVVAEGGGDIPMGPTFDDRGYIQMAKEAEVDLIDLNKRPGTYDESELNRTSIDGTVFKEIPFVHPINDADTVFINVPTMKTHNLGLVSLCGKNLQGTIAMGYRHFCNNIRDALKVEGAAPHYQLDMVKRIENEYRRHVQEGYPRWDHEGDRYEGYAQRTCDALLGIDGFLNIVEGVVGRDGTAFHQGKDVLTNLTLAGVNPVHVDAVTTFLMGHNPQNIGYLKLAAERGLGTIDAEQIPVFLLTEDGPVQCHRLADIGRLELGVYFRGDSSRYVFF